MQSSYRFIRYWLPAILWMILIFTLSSRTRVVVAQEPTVNFLIFKILHMIEYATLYFLLFRGFYSLKKSSLSMPEKYLWPFILSMIYAASDEFHQTFILTREGHPRDVIIDTLGIFFMYIYTRRYISFVKKFI